MTTPDEIEWSRPPERNRLKSTSAVVTPEAVAQLRERPGEWAVVRRASDDEMRLQAGIENRFRGWATSVRQGVAAGFHDGTWEAAVARDEADGGRWKVWVRYVSERAVQTPPNEV